MSSLPGWEPDEAAHIGVPLALREVERLPISEASDRGPAVPSSSTIVLELSAQAKYRCPIYLVALGSRTLRGIVENLVEDGVVHPKGIDGSRERAVDVNAVVPVPSTSSETGAGSCSSVPLPFLCEEVFETVALYWEHFYGVDTHLGRPASATQAATRGEPSALLRVPLDYADLYTLSAWEQVFVLQRLLRLPAILTDRQPQQPQAEKVRWLSSYLRNGAWVDALCTPLGSASAIPNGKNRSQLPPPSQQQQQGSQTATSTGTVVKPTHKDEELVPFSELLLTLPERRAIFAHLCTTLEAATRLGCAGLQHLCAALLAGVMAQLDEEDVGRVVGRHLPPFTEARRQALLAKYPWVAGRATASTSSVEPANASAPKPSAEEEVPSCHT